MTKQEIYNKNRRQKRLEKNLRDDFFSKIAYACYQSAQELVRHRDYTAAEQSVMLWDSKYKLEYMQIVNNLWDDKYSHNMIQHLIDEVISIVDSSCDAFDIDKTSDEVSELIEIEKNRRF